MIITCDNLNSPKAKKNINKLLLEPSILHALETFCSRDGRGLGQGVGGGPLGLVKCDLLMAIGIVCVCVFFNKIFNNFFIE